MYEIGVLVHVSLRGIGYWTFILLMISKFENRSTDTLPEPSGKIRRPTVVTHFANYKWNLICLRRHHVPYMVKQLHVFVSREGTIGFCPGIKPLWLPRRGKRWLSWPSLSISSSAMRNNAISIMQSQAHSLSFFTEIEKPIKLSSGTCPLLQCHMARSQL
jgi:hypothetical protein